MRTFSLFSPRFSMRERGALSRLGINEKYLHIYRFQAVPDPLLRREKANHAAFFLPVFLTESGHQFIIFPEANNRGQAETYLTDGGEILQGTGAQAQRSALFSTPGDVQPGKDFP